jgi:phosphate:Na+ symporter
VVGGEKPNIARYIANSHTMFNLVSAMFFLLILPYLVKVTIWLTPDKKEEEKLDELRHIKYLDTKFVDMPSAAIGQARAEIVRMGEAVRVMYDDVIKSFKERKLKELSKWRKREDDLDNLLREITQFLVHVVQERISPEESKEITSLMRMANNLERIGDAIENIAQLSEELIEEDMYFSEGALHDHELISNEVRKFLGVVIEGIRNEDRQIMLLGQKLEDNIDLMREEMKSNHIMRLQSTACAVDPGLVFVDTLTAFEKIGDFCYNIAQAVAGLK